ncbi:hypothetical protein [Liquorilactobacillus mali]|uniref:Uncharacterized protein n=1 Tax=Liquorilactobacillus mali KCTC 3596 = DSM 20444 TaxID=1046596 RepID=J0UPY8_9LACO|nr:hypothetical protein [Liquorilactobacillus mali]EJE97746.1 hypothetical protein LMA_09143 [Liquorilactobacillus mali KCTC 3596 = DSM 20444]KRN10845.1 hypothetical protein FD00_GL002088 [Liquorilactobacillus mali KCTC 3596 = DSM 20444]
MATKHNSIYWVNNEKYHFETEGASVIIYDDAGNALGTLNDLMLKGKVVENVSFKTIKGTGVYNTKGLTDLPSNIPTDKRAILSVMAIGATANPDVILYKIIGSNGVIAECTLFNGTYTDWSAGGISLQNTINTINTSITALGSRITDTNKSIGDVSTSLNNLATKFGNHNHDGRYPQLSGDTMQGNLGMKYGASYQFNRSNGQSVNMANVDQNDKFTLGNDQLALNILSSQDVKINGHKVYTDLNSGEGSGINADQLDGLDSTKFLRNDIVNKVQADFELENGHELRVMPANNNSTDPYGRVLAASGGLVLGVKGADLLGVYSNRIWSNVPITLSATGAENVVQFTKSKGTIGMYYNDSREEMGFYDYGRGQWLGSFTTGGDGILRVPNAPLISGRRFFLTNDEPKGSIPYGSVWIGF